MNNKEGVKKQIINLLLQQKEPVTISELSKIVSLSEKSVRNYLGELEEELKKQNVEIIKKPNVGVYIQISEEKKAEFKRELNLNEDREITFSPDYRKHYILQTLLKNRYTYTISLLAENLFCSKSTIVNDLVNVQKWVEDRGLNLKRKQNQGLWIEGSEEKIRRSMMDLFFESKDHVNADEIFYEKISALDYRIDLINYKKIKHLFPDIDIFRIQSIVQESERKLGYSFTDQAFVNLIIHIAITIERIKHKKEITMDEEFFIILKNKKFEFGIAEWVTDRLSWEFHISFPKEETAYISLHMISAKIQEGVSFRDYDVLLDIQNKDFVDMAREIVNLVSEILDIDFSNDYLLLVSLVLHLRPTFIKLKYGLKLRNPMLDRIKKEYTNIFGATWVCSSLFEKKMGVSLNEDEVGYIALHIAVAMERVKHKVKAVVVCSSGIGTSQMVAGRIEKELLDIQIVSVLPISGLTEDVLNCTDIIISTVPLRNKRDNIVYISTLVDEIDIINIRNTIKNINTIAVQSKLKITEVINDQEKKQFQLDIIDEGFCFIDVEAENIEEIILKYGQMMVDQGYAKEGYCTNVIEREKESSTFIGKGIAIPHSTEEYVLKSKICIIKLKKPIHIQTNVLKLIIILCLKFNDIISTKKFFKNFYAILSEDKLIKEILDSSNKQEIIKLFKSGRKIT